MEMYPSVYIRNSCCRPTGTPRPVRVMAGGGKVIMNERVGGGAAAKANHS